jgi:hypothetical protein
MTDLVEQACSRWLRSVQIAVLIAGCAACGGSVPPPPPKPAPKLGLCEMSLTQRDGTVRPPRAEDWLHLLIVGESRPDGLYAQALCTGERIESTPLPADCEVQSADPGVPEALPLTEASVVESVLPDNKRLVWIMTHRFPNGDGFGPVAALTLTPKAVYVGSLGLLRLRPTRVDLKLWNIGPKTVLMAAGENCEDPQKAATCRRAANLLVFDKARFHAEPILRSDTHACIDSAWVEYKREADLTLDNGWNRHMRILASLNHDQRYVVITEQVDVTDTDPQHPDVPPRDVRRIDTERFIHVQGSGLYSRQAPLWPRIIPTAGTTQVLRPDDR